VLLQTEMEKGDLQERKIRCAGAPDGFWQPRPNTRVRISSSLSAIFARDYRFKDTDEPLFWMDVWRMMR
jgi:hypothetical protein